MDRVGGGSGAWVYDLRAGGGGGSVLYSDSGKRSRMLASNSKLFATAAYLNRFGVDGKLKTTVWERGARRGRNDQILKGGLVLVGDGDPALAEPGFARRYNMPVTRIKPLAKGVRRAGIKRVRGNLMVDPTVFDGKRSVPQPGIGGGPWLGTLSGLSWNAGLGSGKPEKVAGRELMKHLRRSGVKVTGKVRVGNAPRKALGDEPLDSRSLPERGAVDRADQHPVRQLLRRDAPQAARCPRRQEGHDRPRRRQGRELRPEGRQRRQAGEWLGPQPDEPLVAEPGRQAPGPHVARQRPRPRVPQLPGRRRTHRHALRPHARLGRRGPLPAPRPARSTASAPSPATASRRAASSPSRS